MTMVKAIARQDEALEDLIQSTRQVIQKHTTFLANNNDSNYHRHQHRRGTIHNKPQLQSPQQQPQQHQVPKKSRTKTWFNKIIPSKLQYEIDDEMGLHELKKRIHKQKHLKQEQLPHVKTSSRPMIIPSVSSSPEKVVVVDVPADTTVILRNIAADDVKNCQMAAIYHITDMDIINQLFDHVSLSGSKSTGDIKKSSTAHSPLSFSNKVSKSCTMQPTSIQTGGIHTDGGPNRSSSTCSSATLLNDQPSLKKPKGMTKYLSMPRQLNLQPQKFNYMDSDASTIDYRGDNSPSSLSSTSSSLYCSNPRGAMKHERLRA
ncbi:hypothetical protein BD408DRAFT_482134, partial [Parasitella parasitica]